MGAKTPSGQDALKRSPLRAWATFVGAVVPSEAETDQGQEVGDIPALLEVDMRSDEVRLRPRPNRRDKESVNKVRRREDDFSVS